LVLGVRFVFNSFKPGVKMVKFVTDPKVYAVSKKGVLPWVSTQDLAAQLYGDGWNTKIDDISDAFYGDYTVGSDIHSSSEYSPEVARTSVAAIDDNWY
jgi:hypothetical protein